MATEDDDDRPSVKQTTATEMEPNTVAQQEIVNVVARGDFGGERIPSFDRLTAKLMQTHWVRRPRRFRVIMARRQAKLTLAVMIFETGNVLCVGAKSETSAHREMKTVADVVASLWQNMAFANFKVVHVVYRTTLDHVVEQISRENDAKRQVDLGNERKRRRLDKDAL